MHQLVLDPDLKISPERDKGNKSGSRPPRKLSPELDQTPTSQKFRISLVLADFVSDLFPSPHRGDLRSRRAVRLPGSPALLVVASMVAMRSG